MSYRPKEWDEINTTIPLPTDYPPNEGWVRIMTKEECRIFEAGADTMLEALKPLIQQILPSSKLVDNESKEGK